MAVEGEFARRECISCGRPVLKLKAKDVRYGIDICCRKCLNRISSSMEHGAVAWKISNLAWELKEFRRQEDRDIEVPERAWLKLGTEFALAWAKLRDYVGMKPFPAGLELFLVEILNER